MNLFSVSGLLIAILCYALGILTLYKGKKSIHYIWAFFSFSVALWGFGSYEIGIAQNPEAAIFWWRIGYVGVILIPVFFSIFVIDFLELKKKEFLVALLYIFGVLFLIADFFDGLFIVKVYFSFNQFYYLSSPPILYTAFIILFFSLVIYAHIKLLQSFKISKGIKRDQIKYFLFAIIPGFFAGALEFLPVYKIELYPYLHFIIAFSPLIVTYAILKYRLMDIRIVVRKTFIYLFLAALVYGMFYLVVWLYNKIFGTVFSSGSYLSGIIIAPLFVLLFAWSDNKIKIIANRYLFFSLYNRQKTIAELTDELTNSIDLDKIVDSIVNSIKQAMQLDKAEILLVDQSDNKTKYKIAKVIGFYKNDKISLVQDNFLIHYLQKTQKPLVRDEMQMLAKDSGNAGEKQKLGQLSKNMKHIGASLCLPMIISNKLIGIIILGGKVSGDAYTKEDLELLSTLSKQAAIAIDNARLYKEVQDFNKILRQKVDEQTKDIKQAYEAEKNSKEAVDAIRVEDEALLSSIGDGVIAVDKDGRVMFINKAAEEMLGVEAKDVINNPYEEVLRAENEKGESFQKDKRQLYEALVFGKKTISSSHSNSDLIYYYVRPDKSRFPAAITTTPVILNGVIDGAINVFRDITVEMKTDKSKSEFVSLASHQLRTPLSAIKWYSEMLLGDKSEKLSLKQKKYLKEVYDSNERMIKLIDVLLNVSRLEAGAMRAVPAEIDVKKMIQDIIKEQKFYIKKKKHEIALECQKIPPGVSLKISADPNLIRMVFQNIISNAVKYTPDGGKVTCSISKKGKDILFEVSDTGIGIPKEQQKKVFEKLFRADNAFSYDPQGNGLGLYMAKTTVENLGGDIWFQSEEGAGTKFFVSLPSA